MDYRQVLDVGPLSERLRSGATCLVCVSGGADSMCLLHAMREAAPGLGVAIEAVHINHLVRGTAADEDYELVRATCVRLAVPCHYREIEPLSVKPRGKTTEEYFREQRHGQVFAVAGDRGISSVLMGHTADDLAESFLMHLMRGAGLRGLSFRFAQRKSGILVMRPLWQTTRQRILAYLEAHDVPHREDETNESTAFTRNRVRRLLIPFIEREFNPSARRALRRTTQVLSEAQDHIRSEARRHLRRFLRATADPAALPLKRLLRLSHIMRVEVVHLWLLRLVGAAGRPSFDQCRAVLRLAASREGHRVRLAGGTVIARTDKALVALSVSGATGEGIREERGDEQIAHEELARRYSVQNPALPLARIPEAAPVLDRDARGNFVARLPMLDGRTLQLRLAVFTQKLLPLGGDSEQEVPLPLILRNRQPGDRISPSVRLKSVLINDKVPYYLRDFLVLVTDARRRLLAVVGMERVNARILNDGADSLSLDFEIRPATS